MRAVFPAPYVPVETRSRIEGLANVVTVVKDGAVIVGLR